MAQSESMHVGEPSEKMARKLSRGKGDIWGTRLSFFDPLPRGTGLVVGDKFWERYFEPTVCYINLFLSTFQFYLKINY